MMQPTDYHCKICKVGRVAYYDDTCPIKQLESWKSALTCDRCYNFRSSFLRAKDTVINLCYLLSNFRQSAQDRVEKANALREAESKIRERVTKQTQKISKLCSDYYKVQEVWDIDFVNQIMQRPMHSLRVIDAYHSGFKKLAAL